MRMGRSLLWIITLSLPIIFLCFLAYLLKDSVLSLDWTQLKSNDLINLSALAIGGFGAFIAIGSLFVAVSQLQQAIKDGEEQRQSLDVSRKQLQAVVDAATKQQEILSQNLETSKAQQVLLSKSLETSKIQQEIQHKNLETSKAQLSVLEERQKREAEHLARKPIAEIALQTLAGPILLVDLEKRPPVDFALEKNKTWRKVIFLVKNKGNAEISRPIVRIVASPDKVFVDEANFRMGERGNHNEIQFSGPEVNDIDPVEIAGGAYQFFADITVPDSINAFDLTFSIQGKNLPREFHTLHLKVTRPSS